MWNLPGSGYTIVLAQGPLSCLPQTREVSPELSCARKPLTRLATGHSYILSDLQLDSVQDIWMPQELLLAHTIVIW